MGPVESNGHEWASKTFLKERLFLWVIHQRWMMLPILQLLYFVHINLSSQHELFSSSQFLICFCFYCESCFLFPICFSCESSFMFQLTTNFINAAERAIPTLITMF